MLPYMFTQHLGISLALIMNETYETDGESGFTDRWFAIPLFLYLPIPYFLQVLWNSKSRGFSVNIRTWQTLYQRTPICEECSFSTIAYELTKRSEERLSINCVSRFLSKPLRPDRNAHGCRNESGLIVQILSSFFFHDFRRALPISSQTSTRYNFGICRIGHPPGSRLQDFSALKAAAWLFPRVAPLCCLDGALDEINREATFAN